MGILNEADINEKLKTLNGWKYENNQIVKEYELNDFKSALSFVNKIGEEAEKMDHHPDILLHSWNKVKITISTHSEGGVTGKDFSLAEKIETVKEMSDRLDALLNFFKKDPKDPFVVYGIALEYMAKYQYDNAERYFKILLETDPGYIAGYMQYARLKANQNELEDAKQLYTNGIQKAKEAGDLHAAREMEEFLDELE